ncbi:beta-1,3-galactosyl-O-glycosyl-glycoprotein beta-1,6-N-acetylglucosaminyltransferase-like [Liolophura sinensis]|uniref:beta-1,3-galactosyl-O-glycosyl-glycoprotein beta-1,6-N-acetylglucosaminyltransferase-like n=1 Tax=Liolophura sinensis TaxID=3198878 RepID=UPI0031582F38
MLKPVASESIWLITYSEKVLLNTDFLFEVVASQTIITVENRTEARLQAKPVHFETSIKVKTAISNKTKKKSNSSNSPDLIGHPVVTHVDCNALIRGDIKEKIKAQDVMKREARKTLSGEDYLKLSRNCTEFKLFRGYATDPLSSAEEEFPIAFSVLMYKDIEQSERLLRAIYQPQNHYCIHVDKKSPQILHEGMSAIARCFHNVFIVRNPVTVRWGCSTVLEPDLLCMRQLWPYKNWKYFINLTGQEFPLRTNLELVEILKAYKGANNIEGTRKRARAKRWQKHLPAPQGIIPSQGNVHITASRGYVNYILHNQTALCFLDWVNGTRVPDETFFSTLNHNPHLGVPGSYRGEPESNAMTYPYLTRYISWSHEGKPCHGKFVRKVCIFGVFDLPYLTSLPHLFVNKFHWDYQHFARDCLEEWHFNRTVGKHFLGTNFNVSYYGQWDFVWNKQSLITKISSKNQKESLLKSEGPAGKFPDSLMLTPMHDEDKQDR